MPRVPARVQRVQVATRLAGLRELVVPELHRGEAVHEVLRNRRPPAGSPVPHLSVVFVEDVFDVVDVAVDPGGSLLGLVGPSSQRR